MNTHWVDRLARLAAGTRQPAAPPRHDPGERMLSRRDAVNAAGAFALAGVLGGLRPGAASGRTAQDGCTARCDTVAPEVARRLLRNCLGERAAQAADVFVPGTVWLHVTFCAGLYTGPALMGPILCGSDSFARNADGTCAYPEIPTRLRREFERTTKQGPDKTTRKRQPPRKKPPPKKPPAPPNPPPGRNPTCGPYEVPAGHFCCPSKSNPNGVTVCGTLGCHRSGDGCSSG